MSLRKNHRRYKKARKLKARKLELFQGIQASPKAIELAGEKGINLEDIEGSGSKGRIIVRDVRKAIANQSVEK